MKFRFPGIPERRYAMIWILSGYALVVLAAGLISFKRNRTSSAYIIADRKVDHISSFMSSGIVFIAGIAVLTIPSLMTEKNGLLRGGAAVAGMCGAVLLQWIFVSRRTRIYTEVASDSRTFPSYMENRFHDKTGTLRAFTAAVTMVFFLLLSSAMLSLAARIISESLGLNYVACLFSAALLCGLYLFLGGFPSDVRADTVRFVYVVIVSAVIAILSVYSAVTKGEVFKYELTAAGIGLEAPEVFGITDLMPAVTMAAAVFFMPYIPMRSACLRLRRNPKRFGLEFLLLIIPVLLVCLSVGAWANQRGIRSDIPETLFVSVANNAFYDVQRQIAVFLYICTALAVTDAALLIASSAFSEDIYPKLFNKGATERERFSVSRMSVMLFTGLALAFAVNFESSLIIRPGFVWTVIAASFGPVSVFSLYMKKATWISAFVSIVSGFAAAVFFSCILGSGLPSGSFAELIPSVAVSTAAFFITYVVSPKKPSPEVLDEFGRVRKLMKMKDD